MGLNSKTRPSSPRSLSGLGNVGCSLAAAVHFSPASCPIATAMELQIRRKLSSLGPNFASTPQVRQAPSDKARSSSFWAAATSPLSSNTAPNIQRARASVGPYWITDFSSRIAPERRCWSARRRAAARRSAGAGLQAPRANSQASNDTSGGSDGIDDPGQAGLSAGGKARRHCAWQPRRWMPQSAWPASRPRSRAACNRPLLRP